MLLKKCLDFSATLYIIHLFICLAYGGWPSSVTWWVVNGTGVTVMALLGEYLCIKRELREIPTRCRSSNDECGQNRHLGPIRIGYSTPSTSTELNHNNTTTQNFNLIT
ncbi:hypothetical protein GOBAR_DD10153 [Gossypium barbadense]|nr:hypothetical protein GOBAR_DD10153 [Gossypium barbadense]